MLTNYNYSFMLLTDYFDLLIDYIFPLFLGVMMSIALFIYLGNK